MAVGYVFLHLLPELDECHALLGPRIHYIVLVGFVAYYGLDRALGIRPRPQSALDAVPTGRFPLHLTYHWVYSWLLVYALPGSLEPSPTRMAAVMVSMGLHIAYGDFILASSHARAFGGRGRYVLAAAPLAGCVTGLVLGTDPAIADMLTALLAGLVLYNVFKDELPESDSRAGFGWFVAGVLLYLVLDLTIARATGATPLPIGVAVGADVRGIPERYRVSSIHCHRFDP